MKHDVKAFAGAMAENDINPKINTNKRYDNFII
jgi:hypothetical protein